MEKIKVIFKEVARISIREASQYIEMKGYPETALNFAERLYQFGYSLAAFPNKFPVCRHEKFAKRHLHCSVFEHIYVFVYKTVRTNIVIYNIVHCSHIH
jgi:hypothetical protein